MVFVIKFARLYRHLSSCNTCGCGLLWLFADPCWLWCAPWLSALFCQSWQLPLCSCPARLRKSFVWLSSHYSSTPPAHSSWLSSHRPNTIAAVQPPPNCWKLWLSSTNSHHSPKTCPATTKSQLSSHHPPKAQKFPHHGCWPAFFILQDQMESKLKFIEHLAWKHPCRPLAMGHHQRHETFPSMRPAPSKLPDIYTVMGGVQTSDASGQRKTCICLASCCLWLTSCNGQAGLHICQQILALPQHSRQIAFCHNSHRLPPCICTMHVCVCLSHVLPGWLLALLALKQISWLVGLWYALGNGSHLWRCQTH